MHRLPVGSLVQFVDEVPSRPLRSRRLVLVALDVPLVLEMKV